MHTGLRVLRSHVEPESGCHGNVAITGDEAGVLEELHLAVVTISGEDIGELAIVVVPGELHGASAEVLNTRLIRPGSVGPVPRLVVALGDLFDVIKTLSPEFAVGRIALASLLAPMSEECGQLLFASLLDRPSLLVALITEGWELSDSLQESGVVID